MTARMPNFDELPMPANVEAERLVLGSIMRENDADYFASIAESLTVDAFSLEKHRLIYSAICELHEAGESLDRIVVINKLSDEGHLQSVDGFSYLTSLDDGMPQVVGIESYCKILAEKALLRRTIVGAMGLVNRCLSQADPTEEVLAAAEKLAEMLGDSVSAKDDALTLEETIERNGGINVFLRPELKPGLPVPFSTIHVTLSGLRRSKLIIVAARPGVGKTALASQIAEYVAANGKRVIVASLEMNGSEIFYRSIAGGAQVSAYKFRRGELNPSESRAIQEQTSELVEMGDRLAVYDNPDATVQSLGAMLRRWRARGKPVDLLVVDYLQLMNAPGRHDNRNQEIASISRGLKKLAMRFDIPVLVLSQLSRDLEKRGGEPTLSDLRDSGAIEQDADQVLFLWEGKEANDRDDVRTVSWRVAKNRDGMRNRAELKFFTRFARFEESGSKEAVAA
jgi:replicative DNA helicase